VYPAGPEPTITKFRNLIASLSLLKITLILILNIPINQKIPNFALGA
jgi:hypothetical protein